jgi:galactonate dehydratase
MKIVRIDTFLFDPGKFRNLVYCRIETSDGTYGWGEAFTLRSREKSAAEYIQAMAQIILNENAKDIRRIGSLLYHDFQTLRNHADFFAAWSAIETALWDIAGKAANLPVFALLGGAQRKTIKVYANSWAMESKNLAEIINSAKKMIKMGFHALKWDPFIGPRRFVITKQEEDAAVENVRCVREAVGDTIELLIEMSRRFVPHHAIQFIKRIEEYHPYIIEEPCLASNLDSLKEVRNQTGAKIMAGETFFTKAEFRDAFEKRALDVINPELCASGGILANLEIAAMAETYDVLVSPHNFNGTTIGLAVSVQVAAMISNFDIVEMAVKLKPGCDKADKNPINMKNGKLVLPSDPGLGVDIDVDIIKKYPYREYRMEALHKFYM